MKVIYLIWSFFPGRTGGAERQCRLIARELIGRGVDCSVWTARQKRVGRQGTPLTAFRFDGLDRESKPVFAGRRCGVPSATACRSKARWRESGWRRHCDSGSGCRGYGPPDGISWMRCCTPPQATVCAPISSTFSKPPGWPGTGIFWRSEWGPFPFADRPHFRRFRLCPTMCPCGAAWRGGA